MNGTTLDRDVFLGEVTQHDPAIRWRHPKARAITNRLEEIKTLTGASGHPVGYRVARWNTAQGAYRTAQAINRAKTWNVNGLLDVQCPSGKWVAAVKRDEDGFVLMATFLGEADDA